MEAMTSMHDAAIRPSAMAAQLTAAFADASTMYGAWLAAVTVAGTSSSELELEAQQAPGPPSGLTEAHWHASSAAGGLRLQLELKVGSVVYTVCSRLCSGLRVY